MSAKTWFLDLAIWSDGLIEQWIEIELVIHQINSYIKLVRWVDIHTKECLFLQVIHTVEIAMDHIDHIEK